MFALPPMSPVGSFARSLFGPTLSLTAIWALLSTPGWVLDAHRFYASTLEPRVELVCATEGCRDMTGQACDGELLEAAGSGKAGIVNDPIMTYFNRTATGQLVGWYLVEQDGKTYVGTLSQGQLQVMDKSDSHLYRFRWRDQFGSGDANFIFSPDYSRFGGSWESDQNDEWYSAWSGNRR